MRVKKKFQKVGGTNMIIIPVEWIRSEQYKDGRKMIGVHMDINKTLELSPMWEDSE